MIADAVVVLRKEALEFAGDRHSLRGALFQATVMLMFVGVYLPTVRPALWSSPSLLAMVYVVVPSILAAAVAADAFAGERERKTLETLLSTPLADSSVFLGKAGWAVLYSFIIAIGALGCGLLTTRIAQGALHSSAPTNALLTAALVALASAVATTSLAISVSSRVPVSRSAQQVTLMASMALLGVAATLVKARIVPLDWGGVCEAACVVLVAGFAALALAALSFRRERIVDGA